MKTKYLKQNYFKWLFLFVTVVMCIGFASCGDDEEVKPDNGGNTNNEVSFVGTWKHTFSGGYSIFVINTNGRGTYIEYNNGGQKTDEDRCTWKVEGERLTLVYDDDPNDIDTDIYKITFVSNDVVWLTDIDGSDDNDPEVWYRQ